MIKVYGIKANKVQSTELSSLEEINMLAKKSDWLWVDCLEQAQKNMNLSHNF